jgi:hypothetical protein
MYENVVIFCYKNGTNLVGKNRSEASLERIQVAKSEFCPNGKNLIVTFFLCIIFLCPNV